MLDVEKEASPSTCAVFITRDGHVSVGYLIEIFEEICHTFKATLETTSNTGSSTSVLTHVISCII